MKRVLLSALLLLVLTVPGQTQYRTDSAATTGAGWYRQYLGRAPDPYAQSWIDGLRAGQDPTQLLSGIIGSQEYYDNAGGTPAGFVTQLYLDVVGRRPTGAELRSWTARMYRESRDDIAYALLTRYQQDYDP